MQNNNSSPSIIFNLAAHLPKHTSDINNFFRCKNSRNIINYITRNDAADKKDETTQSLIDSSYELNKNLTEKDFISYANNRPGSTGLFTKDSLNLSPEDARNVKKSLSETKSIIWSSVISFTPEIAEQFCRNKGSAQDILNQHLPALFKNSQLDYENISWFGAFHINTLHPHIHLLFLEKEPLALNSKGELSYTKKFILPKENFQNFKASINKTFSVQSLDYLSLRDNIRSSMRLNLTNNRSALQHYYNDAASVMNNPTSQYGRLKPSEQKVIDRIVKDIIFHNPSLSKTYDEYTECLLNTQNEYRELYQKNHITIPDNVHKFYDNRVGELHNRLGNELIKQLKNFGQQEKEINDAVKKVVPKCRFANSANLIRTKNMKSQGKYEIKKLMTALEQNSAGEIITMRNQLDRYRAMLRNRGEELIDEEYSEHSPEHVAE